MMRNLNVDAVFVLSVKTFEDRINHVKRQMALHNIQYQFIFEFDIPDLNPQRLTDTFASEDVLARPQQSLVLKHIHAWRMCVEHKLKNILVFEDDVILKPDFVSRLNEALSIMEKKEIGYLLFLGGADTKVPDSFLLSNDIVVEQPIATTEAYLTNYSACVNRLDWLVANRVSLPSDFLLRTMDPICGVSQYWLKEPIADQGSVTGVFESSLDEQRKKHSLLYNYFRFQWQKINRKKLRKIYAVIKNKFMAVKK
jgi:glycosyl transferase family 25